MFRSAYFDILCKDGIHYFINIMSKISVVEERQAKRPNGKHRPADVASCAVKVAKIATSEIEDAKLKYLSKHNSGIAGGNARAKALDKSKRTAIAKKAAVARWAVQS